MPTLHVRFSIAWIVAAGICVIAPIPGLSGVASAQNDLTDIPVPDPVAEMAAMNVHDGAVVNLFAADPDIAKPVQMNFDSTGGLWIASSEVYPQIRPGEVANDKIIVLRDTDGDGVCDSRKVFADGLLIPTGVLPDGPHAAYIVDSTRLLYMQDTDHDGRADESRVVLSGFGTEDTTPLGPHAAIRPGRMSVFQPIHLYPQPHRYARWITAPGWWWHLAIPPIDGRTGSVLQRIHQPLGS